MPEGPPRGRNHLFLSPEQEAETNRLRVKFEDGDMLAAFECCAVCQRENYPSKALPEWVLDYLVKTGAEYFEKGPRKCDRPVLPRELLEMNRVERDAVLPSLDREAKLVGSRGTMGAWLMRAEHDRDAYVQAYLDDLMKQHANKDRPFVTTAGGARVPVFVETGKNKDAFRTVALDAIAKRFRIRGQANSNRAKTMRRRFRLTDK